MPIFARSIKLPHFDHFALRQLGARAGTSASNAFWVFSHSVVISRGQASLFHCIFSIVSIATFKQMTRTATAWIVTMMQSVLRRPYSGCQKHCYAICFQCSPSVSKVVTPIATSKRAFPFPAFTIWPLAGSLIDIRPKSQNLFACQLWWNRVRFAVTHVLKAISFQNVAGLRGRLPRSRRLNYNTGLV